jgi:hypothetical protein
MNYILPELQFPLHGFSVVVAGGALQFGLGVGLLSTHLPSMHCIVL